MQVPQYIKIDVQEAIIAEFVAISDGAMPMIAPQLHRHFKDMLDLIKARLTDTVMDILTVEKEGAGNIHILRIDNSPAHRDLLKITAIKHGGAKQRIARLQGENPNGDVIDVFSRPFVKRLEKQNTLHKRLGNRKHPKGSKWYEMDEESAIASIRALL